MILNGMVKKIMINDLEVYLREAERQELRLSRHHWSAVANATSKKLTDQLNETYKYNPEYILVESERKALISYFWEALEKRIGYHQYAILRMYITYKNNAVKTGQELGLSESAIRKNLKKIQKEAFDLLQKINLSVPDFKESLVPEINNYFASSTSNVGYPFEHYMNVPYNKQWQDKFGLIRGKKNKSCLIPEYLQDCNLHDCQCIICTDTNNCRRKDAFPENDRTEALKRSRDKITAITDNIIANTPASAYDGLERIYSL